MPPLILFFALTARAFAQCAAPHTETELDAALARAELAWEEPGEAFVDASGVVEELLACLAEPASPRIAGRVHRFAALRAFRKGEIPLACQELTAARKLAPKDADPEWIITADRLRGACGSDRGSTAAGPVPPPRPPMRVLLDGRNTLWRAQGASTVFQTIDGEGRVTTVLLGQEDPPPAYEVSRAGRNLAIGAGAAALGAVAAFVGNYALYEAWPEVPASRAQLHYDATNALYGVSVGLGVVSVGLAAGGVVAQW